jgi:hypothetical protein
MWASYDPKDPSRAYYGTDTRAAAILLGGALAAWHSAWGPVRSRWARVLLEIAGLVGLVVLAVAWWRWDGDSPALYQGGFAACGAAGAAVIAASVHPQRGPLARGFAWPPLRGLGIVSYGVYLWHWPIYLVLDPARTGLPSVPLLGVRVTATLLVALASYALVERPILRGALRWRQWAVIAPGATAAIVAAILAATAGPRAPRDSPIAAAPEIAPTGRVAARILILGDSLGVSLFSGLARAGAEPGLEFALGVKIGCERASTARDCPPPWPTQVAQQRPDAVLVVDSGSWSIYPLRTGSRVIPIGDASWDEAWIQQRQAIVDDLLAAGTQRLVFTTIPCIEPYWWQQREPRLAPENVARANANLATLAARNPERVRLIDLAGYVCPGNRYRPDLESVRNARVDGLHFSPEGAELVGRWLAPQLARAAGL